VGAVEDWVVVVGGDVRPGMRRNWLALHEDKGLRLVFVLIAILMMSATRGDSKGKEEK